VSVLLSYLARSIILDVDGLLAVRSRVMAPPVDLQSDGALVLRARDGDMDAARSLFLRYADIVSNVTLRLLRHRADAEDAAQETFARALDRLDQLRQPDDFRRWVMTIAVNTCRQKRREAWWRRVGARLGVSDLDAPLTLDALATPTCTPEVREALAAIDRALRTLPETQRDAWTLHVVQGCTLPDTAAACGCSLATVKRWIVVAETVVASAASRDDLEAP
jgi:RNA polymerase sigma-70 factor, ECF subfamily